MEFVSCEMIQMWGEKTRIEAVDKTIAIWNVPTPTSTKREQVAICIHLAAESIQIPASWCDTFVPIVMVLWLLSLITANLAPNQCLTTFIA